MNIQKEIIKILRQPINGRGFKSKKITVKTQPYYTLSDYTAGRLAKYIMAVCKQRNKEIAGELLEEDVGKLVDIFGKYPHEARKFVVEGFVLARSYILNNKMRL